MHLGIVNACDIKANKAEHIPTNSKSCSYLSRRMPIAKSSKYIGSFPLVQRLITPVTKRAIVLNNLIEEAYSVVGSITERRSKFF